MIKAEFGHVDIFPRHRGGTVPVRDENCAPASGAFMPGDTVTTHDHKSLDVESVTERQGMLFYAGKDREDREAELSDTISFSKPEDRLHGGADR